MTTQHPYRSTLPISELRDRSTASRRERAVEKRREQEGTAGRRTPKPPQTPSS